MLAIFNYFSLCFSSDIFGKVNSLLTCSKMDYTAREYRDMLYYYGMARGNACAAARFYAEDFPNRRHPTHMTIINCFQRAGETGMLQVRQRHEIPARRHVNIEEQVLQVFEENPRSSIRRVSRAIGVSQTTIFRILHENGLRPYHFRRVQQIYAHDEIQRIYFCEGLLAQCRRDAAFPDRILWTDEATFTPNGVFNSKNFLLWQEENPRAIRPSAFQYRWSINVWAGVIADRVIGPYFLPPRVNEIIYADFLQNNLPVLLEDVSLRAREMMIFQHDGAPAHYSRRVREFLNTHFRDKWMGRGGPIIWPARSPDLNVLDYFVWGHIKSLIEYRRDGTENEVRDAIIAAFNTITPDMAHRATRQIIRRAELCLEARGKHFEQHLH